MTTRQPSEQRNFPVRLQEAQNRTGCLPLPTSGRHLLLSLDLRHCGNPRSLTQVNSAAKAHRGGNEQMFGAK